MPHRAQQAIRDWNAADEIARSAEARLKDAWNAFDAGRGPPPGRELINDVARARSFANTLLAEAMKLMEEAAR
jgi:hypothetical protein